MHGSRSRAPNLGAFTTHESVLPLLAKSLSVFGRVDRFDANTAQPAVLAAIGLSPEGDQCAGSEPAGGADRRQQLPELLQSVGAATAPLACGRQLDLYHAGDGAPPPPKRATVGLEADGSGAGETYAGRL